MGSGFANTGAISDEGKAFSWGSSEYCELGDGTDISKNYPVAVYMSGALKGKIPLQVSAGGSLVNMITTDGKLYNWGHGVFSYAICFPTAVTLPDSLLGQTFLHVSSDSSKTAAIAR